MKSDQSFSKLSEGEGQLDFKLWLIFDSYLILAATQSSDCNTSWQSDVPGLDFPVTC